MTKSLEDYLEAIFRLKIETGSARVVDIANALGVKMPSVNNAIKELARRGLLIYRPYYEVSLSAEGEKAAQEVYECHTTLKKFLLSLGISKENAEIDACAMEHILSKETIDCFRKITTEGAIDLSKPYHQDNAGK